MKKTAIFIAFFAVLSFAFWTGVVPAAHADGECDFNARLKQFAIARADASLGILQAVRTELSIRKDLLSSSIACDEQALAGRQADLAKLPDAVKAMPVYGHVSSDLDDSVHFYDQQKVRVSDLGIQGTKDMARSIAAWRDSNYSPAISLADDLLLWASNQDLFTKVSNRLAQVNRVAVTLKLVDQGDVADKYQKAEDAFKTASDENNAAKDALNNEDPDAALGHIKASLQALADTYKVFFDLEGTLQKVIK